MLSYSNMFSDMSGRKLYIGANSWLALLAIGYLAVGAPLAHPFFHDHHGGPDDHGNPSGMMIQAAVVDAIEHDGLICHFVGVSHVVLFNRPPLSAETVPTNVSLGAHPVLYVQLSTNPIPPVDRRSAFARQSPDNPIYISTRLDDDGRFAVVYPQGGMR